MLAGSATSDLRETRLALRLVALAQLFLAVGMLVQLLSAPMLLGFPYGPALLALTHLLTLGWATLTCLGVLTQLLPVLLQRPLAWLRLATWSQWPLALGCALFSWAFGAGSAGWLLTGALLLSAGLLALLTSLWATLWRARRSALVAGVALALLALTVQLGAGIVLVLNRRWVFWSGLGLNGVLGHALLGVGGWFTVLTIALSYRLLPMFTLAHGYRVRWSGVAPLGWALSAYAAWLGLWLAAPRWWLWLAWAVALLSTLAWLADLRTIMRQRVRRRIERPIRAFLGAAALLLLLLLVAALALANWALLPLFKQAQLIFMLALEGWIGWAILAMLHKILPFLIWILRSDQPGAARPTVAHALFHAQLTTATLLLYPLGLALLLGGVALNLLSMARIGGAALLLAALGLLLNLGWAMRLRAVAAAHWPLVHKEAR